MSVRRFIGYFVVLSACSTVAFASSLIGQPPLQDRLETDLSLPLTPNFPIPMHSHKSMMKHSQVAQAE